MHRARLSRSLSTPHSRSHSTSHSRSHSRSHSKSHSKSHSRHTKHRTKHPDNSLTYKLKPSKVKTAAVVAALSALIALYALKAGPDNLVVKKATAIKDQLIHSKNDLATTLANAQTLLSQYAPSNWWNNLKGTFTFMTTPKSPTP